jgi:hypothetical protein
MTPTLPATKVSHTHIPRARTWLTDHSLDAGATVQARSWQIRGKGGDTSGCPLRCVSTLSIVSGRSYTAWTF